MALVRKTYRTWTGDEIREACKLCLVTEDSWLDHRTLHSCVAEAIIGGVTLVRFRSKNSGSIDMVRTARNLAAVCRIANVPLVVNDDIEAAKIAGVDGVHLGPGDVPCAEARAQLGPEALVGVTAWTVEKALSAEKHGASYLAVGPIFKSPDGLKLDLVPLDTVRDIVEAVDIPVVGMGGIEPSNVSRLSGLGLSGVAAKSAILSTSDIEQAAREMACQVNEYVLGDR